MVSKYKDKLLSTKLQISIGIIILSSIFLFFEKISSIEWTICTLFISAFYVIGNVVSARFKAFNLEASIDGDSAQKETEK